jgi:antirestriction protein ArdC
MATRNVSQRDVLKEVTDAVIECLERGVMPWRRPWIDGKATSDGVPHNAITGRAYSGVNYVQLTMAGLRYTSQGWLTFKQAKEAGGNVRKGEKGTAIVFWRPLDRTKRDEDGSEHTERFLMLRTFTVFNIAQCDGVKLPKRRSQLHTVPVDPSDAMGPARACVDALKGCSVAYGGNKAFYVPSADAIRMPAPEQFTTMDHFRATLAHECAHATGSKERLDRDLTGRFGSESYAAEELVAELASAMVGARLGFDTALIEHHAAYLEDWLRVLKGDRKALLTAASKAQQACNYLVPESVESEDDEQREEPVLAMAA